MLGNGDFARSAGMGTRTCPGSHCCGEFAGAQLAMVHAVGRCPQSKPAACPSHSLGNRGFSVNPDHFPDLGHGSTDTHADALEGCLRAEGVAPTRPWVGCGSIQPPLPDAEHPAWDSQALWDPQAQQPLPNKTLQDPRQSPPCFPTDSWVGKQNRLFFF